MENKDFICKDTDKLVYSQKNFKLKTSQITVSGFSSGAMLTANILAFFNKKVRGGAIIAGPYHGFTTGADSRFYGIKGQRVYIFGGRNDKLVNFKYMEATAYWFKAYKANVKTLYNNWGHTYSNSLPPSIYNQRQDCSKRTGMLNCPFDQSGKYLAHIQGKTLKPWNLKYNNNGQFYRFSTKPYINLAAQMLDWGYIYVPNQCIGKNCPLHLYFHGCTLTAGWRGSLVARKTGLLQHASANGMVVIFLNAWQTNEQYQKSGGNLKHCWISSGLDQINHPQILAIRRIVKAFYDRELFTDDQPLPSPSPGGKNSGGNGGNNNPAKKKASTSSESGRVPKGNSANSTALLTQRMCGKDNILTWRDVGCMQLMWQEDTSIATSDISFYNNFWLIFIGEWMYAISWWSPLLVWMLPEAKPNLVYWDSVDDYWKAIQQMYVFIVSMSMPSFLGWALILNWLGPGVEFNYWDYSLFYWDGFTLAVYLIFWSTPYLCIWTPIVSLFWWFWYPLFLMDFLFFLVFGTGLLTSTYYVAEETEANDGTSA